HLPSKLVESDTWDQKKVLVERADSNNDGKISRFERFRARFIRFITRILPYRKPVVIAYLLIISGIAALLLMNVGRDVLPKTNGGQFQVRLRAPEGTRMERTEEKTLAAIHSIEDLVGKENVSISSSYVGQHPSLFSVSPIYLFMPGPHEAVV